MGTSDRYLDVDAPVSRQVQVLAIRSERANEFTVDVLIRDVRQSFRFRAVEPGIITDLDVEFGQTFKRMTYLEREIVSVLGRFIEGDVVEFPVTIGYLPLQPQRRQP